MKLCEFENCKKDASYAYTFMKPIFCKEHKKDNMKTKTYVCMCGKAKPSLGLESDKRPSCCVKCKTDKMINITNINKQKCTCGKVTPSYGLKDDIRPTCCVKCKTNEMIYIKNKKCMCEKTIPSFGLLTDNTPTCCSKCKTDEMINIREKRKCKCGKARPLFGLSTDITPTCCTKCRTNEMIDLNHKKKCKCGKAQPYFGLETDKIPTCCSICRTVEMIDIVNLRCKSNYLEDGKKFECSTGANKKYKGYCSRCYAYHFPNDPLTFQINCKTKEMVVRNYINSQFEGFFHDIPLWIGACECIHRRRVDHRKLIGNTLLCIETDENQHKYYDKKDENARYNDVMMIHGGKFIFIRFNPDKYEENGKKKNPNISTRLTALKKEVDKQIKRIQNEENEELIEEIYMYYDIKS